tara:strand:+ start:72 stop:194 length:123 start_codon:yes stop_codon:yes gene_type:complete
MAKSLRNPDFYYMGDFTNSFYKTPYKYSIDSKNKQKYFSA